MKKISLLLLLACLLGGFSGCAKPRNAPELAATTLPVYEFTSRLCRGTDITVGRLVTESVSCLHDYTLQVSQMRDIEGAEAVVISGGGLEHFLDDALADAGDVIDCSAGIPLRCAEEDDHGAGDHRHDQDPHFWLSPPNAKIMARNICEGLCTRFPQHAAVFQENLTCLLADLDALDAYGQEALASLSTRELVTFHDGFSYFADRFGLTILRAVEEESGSEAPAATLIELISLIREHHLPAIFTESNGSTAAAEIIARETGATLYTLDMAMAGDSYFDAMYHNIDTIKEALG